MEEKYLDNKFQVLTNIKFSLVHYIYWYLIKCIYLENVVFLFAPVIW